MALVTPTAESAPTYPAQAVIDATDLGALAAGLQGSGVASGCQVSPLATAGYAVAIAAGSILVQGCLIPLAAVTSLAPSAASSNDRRDIVVASAAGVVSLVTGTPCSVAAWTTSSTGNPPVKPAVPSGSVLLGEVYVPGGGGNLVAANLVDKTTVIQGASINVPSMGPGAIVSAPNLNGGYSFSLNGTAVVAGDLYAVPLAVAAGAAQIAGISINIDNPGSTGAEFRIGIFGDTGANYPGALIEDCGVVAATSAGSVQTVTPTAVIEWPQNLWIGVVLQGAPETTPTIQGFGAQGQVAQAGYATVSDVFSNQGTGAWLATGVTGALPATFPAGAAMQTLNNGNSNVAPVFAVAFKG